MACAKYYGCDTAGMKDADLKQKLSVLSDTVQILFNQNMAAYTTFCTGGDAAAFVCIETIGQLITVLKTIRQSGIQSTVIGRGSNLLVSDKGYDGVIIKLGYGFNHITINKNKIYADAGCSLRNVCATAIKNGLAGLEFAGGIPGSVGGGIMMNAGAYGGELSDFVTAVKVLTPDLTVKDLTARDMDFSYRHSCIAKKEYIVLGAEFTLDYGESAASQKKMDDFNARRREKQPLTFASAGSTFKRPTGYYAGALIEQCGLKGCRKNQAQVCDKHAGFIINLGGAASQDIYTLIKQVQHIVFEKTGVLLEPEITFLGDFDD
ncbi:MAG: UDP-N-acetylmuramate dehydrogenase [Christensenellaceae bacterium]